MNKNSETKFKMRKNSPIQCSVFWTLSLEVFEVLKKVVIKPMWNIKHTTVYCSRNTLSSIGSICWHFDISKLEEPRMDHHRQCQPTSSIIKSILFKPKNKDIICGSFIPLFIIHHYLLIISPNGKFSMYFFFVWRYLRDIRGLELKFFGNKTRNYFKLHERFEFQRKICHFCLYGLEKAKRVVNDY